MWCMGTLSSGNLRAKKKGHSPANNGRNWWIPLQSHNSFSRMMIDLPIQPKNDYNLVCTPRARCFGNEGISQKMGL